MIGRLVEEGIVRKWGASGNLQRKSLSNGWYLTVYQIY
jgi:hypothetical protein